MAGWILHCAIADQVLAAAPGLSRRDFAIGSIAPDCNQENEDWTQFIPSREVTHFMQGERKTVDDADVFCEEYLIRRAGEIEGTEQRDFLLGYYAHLIADGLYQAFIRDEERVRTVWRRIKADPKLSARAIGMEENWDSVKILLTKTERNREIHALEAEYLASRPDSTYLTEILPTRIYPDWLDILPHGAIARKIAVMGNIPGQDPSCPLIALSRQEVWDFVKRAANAILQKII